MPSLGSINYVENSGPQSAARNASFSGAANYAGGYVTFSIATPSSSESLNLPSTSTASTSTGVITVVGTTSLVTWLECKVLIACTLQLLGQVAISWDKDLTI